MEYFVVPTPAVLNALDCGAGLLQGAAMNEDDPYQPPEADPTPHSVPELESTVPGFENVAWPLTLSFKVLALARQIKVTDAGGREVMYVRQKILKFKEQVEVFQSSARTNLVATIQANKVIDWSARYRFTLANGDYIGDVGRKGWRSIWKAHYQTFNPGDDTPDYDIQEENPMAKVMDSLIGEVPVLGFFTGYLFHPKFAASRPDGEVAMRLTKQPAFWEGKFLLEKFVELPPREEANLVLSFLMLIALERRRG